MHKNLFLLGISAMLIFAVSSVTLLKRTTSLFIIPLINLTKKRSRTTLAMVTMQN